MNIGPGERTGTGGRGFGLPCAIRRALFVVGSGLECCRRGQFTGEPLKSQPNTYDL